MIGASLQDAVRVVANGGIIAYPTESCFGLGCDPRNEHALARLLRLKRRQSSKGFIVIGSDFGQLKSMLLTMSEDHINSTEATWPGPVTWLMPCKSSLSRRLRGQHKTLAVRVTAHPVACRLCQLRRGPLVSTSANATGEPALRSAAAVKRRFGKQVDYCLVGRVGAQTEPSEIRDLLTNNIIRAA